MKICYIANLYPPNTLGGAEIIVEKCATRIAQEHDVIVITTSPDHEEHIIKEGNMTIYQINTTPLYPVYKQTENNGPKKVLWHLLDLYNAKTLQRIEEVVKKEEIELVHLNNYKGLSMSVFKIGKKLGIPLVFESHDFSLICPRANLIRGNNTLCTKRNPICDGYVKIQRKLLDNNVDLLISPSNFMIEKFHENGVFENTESTKIPLGVEIEKKHYTKSYDTINFTYIGSLGKHKGVHILIQAFKEIQDENIELNIYGKGYDEEEFRKMAENDERIKFHGYIANNELAEVYRKANMTVIPSICYDNSPMVIYESFSTATPTLASNIGGIPELVEDGYNGLLFQAESIEDIKNKIVYVINNKQILRQLEENAYESLPDDSINVMTERLLAEYEKLLNDKK
ncbi:MAG: hypothetical protein BZ136_01975 [Methanosphaera sp. rholeuAM74]|nr:MAG: hypothetical protein BZ136_01975 [Methanosphaera sp. rholeuAM74]